jgi:CRISPR-associated exonuclease Cas4
MPVIILILLAAALLILWLSVRQRKKTGIPAGKIVSADTSKWGLPQKDPLYDPELKLVGKPDYVIRERGFYIPVEVKSCAAREAPYDSHLFQLAAYCRLVETTTGRRPPYGILHYRNRTYTIEYTPWLEEQLLNALQEIRQAEKMEIVARSHQSPARCKGCGYRSTCDERL